MLCYNNIIKFIINDSNIASIEEKSYNNII